MPAFIAMLLGGLIQICGSLVGRVLVSLGISLVTYTGMSVSINYLKGQITAGVDIIQIFDSWAGILSPEQYNEFSLRYISRICDAIPNVTKTVFAKGAFFSRTSLNLVDCNVVGLDWNMGIQESRMLMPDKVLQGNLDPCALYGSIDDVRRETKKMLKSFEGSYHIANLGHGLYPDTEVDKVKCFIDTVKEYQS